MYIATRAVKECVAASVIHKLASDAPKLNHRLGSE
jgi:hypothetical protein